MRGLALRAAAVAAAATTVAGLSGAAPAEAASRKPAVKSPDVRALLDSGKVRVVVPAKRRSVVSVSLRSGKKSVRLTRARKVGKGKRARKRVAVALTKRGERALQGCVQQRVLVVSAKPRGRKVRRARAALPCGEAMSWSKYDRKATNGMVTDKNVKITMRDGTVLDANISRPDKPGRYPVLITQHAYGKDVAGGALGGGGNFLVERGYVQVDVDSRGTGSSQGQWDAFGEAEQRDGPEVVAWAARQSWSNGKVGLTGPSYMGLNQLLTAAQRPKALKAIFPVVPMADGYRDIVFSGGSINAGFIPLWLGLVTVGGITPPPYALGGDPNDLVRGVSTLLSHVSGAVNFQANTLLGAATGSDLAYDGPFWKTRSPLEGVDKIKVPTFVMGGLHDIFQRGEPIIYERLRKRVPARLVMGPWTHVDGSQAAGLPRDGVPSLNSLQLRWFDHWLKGMDTGIDDIPRVTQYVLGEERYEVQRDWPDPKLDTKRLYLRGGRTLSEAAPRTKEPAQSFLQHPLSGICTQSTSQWTAGLGGVIPCTQDNRLNEALGDAVYTTGPMSRDFRINGPVSADIWLTTTTRDSAVTVRVTDVGPSGESKELTTGWLAATFRAVDERRTRKVRGQTLQPWHPYTRQSVLPVKPGEPTRLAVEVFPTSATIKKGHRLRVTVSPSDFPHQLPPLPAALNSLAGGVRILNEPGHASSITLPTPGSTCAVKKRKGAKRCPALPVPDLTRGF